jgi:hypothetical protein
LTADKVNPNSEVLNNIYSAREYAYIQVPIRYQYPDQRRKTENKPDTQQELRLRILNMALMFTNIAGHPT